MFVRSPQKLPSACEFNPTHKTTFSFSKVKSYFLKHPCRFKTSELRPLCELFKQLNDDIPRLYLPISKLTEFLFDTFKYGDLAVLERFLVTWSERNAISVINFIKMLSLISRGTFKEKCAYMFKFLDRNNDELISVPSDFTHAAWKPGVERTVKDSTEFLHKKINKEELNYKEFEALCKNNTWIVTTLFPIFPSSQVIQDFEEFLKNTQSQ
ncbi:hypothetical protein Ciccas_011084 [Cichlidogyrus casuarinus]|uniref:Uncharacterized protein n=1 Tax=Cichlidogyrus casuarinus TaxID=1844966 RepID=A0ABD2PTF8_9PLAT